MDEDQIYDDYLEESKKYLFPACRYWVDGQVVGDNLDVFINYTFGDPEEIVGTTEEDGYWVTLIIKEGVEQEKKYPITEVGVLEGEEFPFTEYPTDTPEDIDTPMEPSVPEELPDIPETDETTMEDQPTELPDIDDSEDIQVESGEDNIEFEFEDPESEGSIDNIPEGAVEITIDEDGYALNRFNDEYISPEDLELVYDEEGYIIEY